MVAGLVHGVRLLSHHVIQTVVAVLTVLGLVHGVLLLNQTVVQVLPLRLVTVMARAVPVAVPVVGCILVETVYVQPHVVMIPQPMVRVIGGVMMIAVRTPALPHVQVIVIVLTIAVLLIVQLLSLGHTVMLDLRDVAVRQVAEIPTLTTAQIHAITQKPTTSSPQMWIMSDLRSVVGISRWSVNS